MKKLLSGSELAGYIKERQARDVRRLRQALGTTPHLAIVQTKDDPVINTYVRLKKRYGADIGAEVSTYFVDQARALGTIQQLNDNPGVHGIIVQLPLYDPSQTDELIAAVAPQKDVDALGPNAPYDPATPLAILWLLAGYAIDLAGKHIVLVGRGKLVGAPLERLFADMGLDCETVDRSTPDLAARVAAADIVITATGSPAILFPAMLKQGAVVVDAGVASEDGKTVGDLHASVYERDDLTLTPVKGGVGPLTVCALFENTLRAAEKATLDRGGVMPSES